jgi:bifunctional pyridoxal-dependent enzyme with beta-cystathionase and maltose regulon repressor activities
MKCFQAFTFEELEDIGSLYRKYNVICISDEVSLRMDNI